MIEPEVLSDMWTTLKGYIPAKEKQAAADHIINVIADHSITEQELREFAGVDSYLSRALKEYLGDDEDEHDITEDDD
jgi:hypothetical protein